MVQESFNHQIKHILSMQYSTAELRLRALEDVLSGPDHLHATLPTALSEIRQVRSGFTDATTKPDPDAFPAPKRKKPPRRGVEPTKPKGKARILLTAAVGAARQLLPVPHEATAHPEVTVPAMDSYWWRLSGLNSAVVSTRDGTAASWYQRDQHTARDLMTRTVEVHNRILKDWPSLREQYREAAPEFTGAQAWLTTFGEGD
jgi:galactofuranosylgalactofuranosylrhamnosyl-N-acetylglucosaminyl-diphospho-decaprenol beta-1,5/1,6-galactofuranosyltransferase